MTGVSRRDFIRLSTATSGLALLGCRGTRKPASTARVVVIGGGYGGATAAKYLKILDGTIDVTLVEKKPRYYSCPGSNSVLGGISGLESLARNCRALQRHYGVRLVEGEALAVDSVHKEVKLDDGKTLGYERLIMSPGIDFRWDAIAGYDRDASESIPHAWQAGPQTLLLKRQLEAMSDGGVVIIAPPANPFRCPPGPYERASLIAYYLSTHKPRAKILIVDAKSSFSKQALFQRGWQDLYPGMIEWIPPDEEGVIERLDARSRTVFTEIGEHRGDVLNLIPPQRAGAIAHLAGVTDQTGWCPVDMLSFESKLVPTIHVIGDASLASPMPKSAFSANSQAKTCAAAVAALLRGDVPEMPAMINTCYSYLNPDYAISVSAVYEYSTVQQKVIATSSGVTPMENDRAAEARAADSWHENIVAEVFR